MVFDGDRAFSIASTACPAKVCNNVGMVGAKPPAVRRRITSPPTTLSSRNSGTARTAWMPSSNPPRTGGGFDHGIQHRLHIRGRSADDVEHIAGRGLVFERFFEVARARLQFAEQPRVLDCDDRLVGEGPHQLDLPLGE